MSCKVDLSPSLSTWAILMNDRDERRSLHLEPDVFGIGWPYQTTPYLTIPITRMFGVLTQIVDVEDWVSADDLAEKPHKSLEEGRRLTLQQTSKILVGSSAGVDEVKDKFMLLNLKDTTTAANQGSSSRSTRSQMKSTTAIAGTWRRQNTTGKRPSRSKRDKSNNGDEDGSDDEEKGGEDNGKGEACEGHGNTSLACPFAKADPYTNRGCLTKRLRSITALKQHLRRVHRAPDWYHFRCHQSFENEDQYEEHIHTNGCVKTPYDGPGLIKHDSWRQHLETRFRGPTLEEKWFNIFKGLFPYEQCPDCPHSVHETVLHFQNLFQALPPGTLRQMQIGLDASRNQRAASLPWQTRLIMDQALAVVRQSSATEEGFNEDIQASGSSMSKPLYSDRQQDHHVNAHQGFLLPRDDTHQREESFDSTESLPSQLDGSSSSLGMKQHPGNGMLATHGCSIDTEVPNCYEVGMPLDLGDPTGFAGGQFPGVEDMNYNDINYSNMDFANLNDGGLNHQSSTVTQPQFEPAGPAHHQRSAATNNAYTDYVFEPPRNQQNTR